MRAHLKAKVEQVMIHLRVLLCLLPRLAPHVNAVIFDNDSEGAGVSAHRSLREAE